VHVIYVRRNANNALKPFRVTCNAKALSSSLSSSFRDTRLDRNAPNEPIELDTRNSVAATGLILFNAERGRVYFVENFGAVKVAVGILDVTAYV